MKRIVREFRNLVTAAIEPSIFENLDPVELEKRLIAAETSLAAAVGCVDAMRRVWPEGDDVYDRFLLAVSELTRRRNFVQAFAELIASDAPLDELRAQHARIMAANREALMITTTYMEEAADVLRELTGIELEPG